MARRAQTAAVAAAQRAVDDVRTQNKGLSKLPLEQQLAAYMEMQSFCGPVGLYMCGGACRKARPINGRQGREAPCNSPDDCYGGWCASCVKKNAHENGRAWCHLCEVRRRRRAERKRPAECQLPGQPASKVGSLDLRFPLELLAPVDE